MQTFLPYADFEHTAHTLDYKRLGKQRVEAKQIYLALTEPTYGWRNHPAVLMWRGHEAALMYYGLYICAEWVSRGYNDTLLDWFFVRAPRQLQQVPSWIGSRKFHRSHQSNLLRKDWLYYHRKFPNVPDNLPYIWPS